MSTAILTLSENGQLQKIHDFWLLASDCPSNTNDVDSSQLSLNSFWGLFLITGSASLLSLVIYLIRLLWQFSRRHSEIQVSTRSFSSRSKTFIKSFASYVDESEKPRGKRKRSNGSGRKKKTTPYLQDHNSPSSPNPSSQSDQSFQSDQSSPDRIGGIDADFKHSSQWKMLACYILMLLNFLDRGKSMCVEHRRWYSRCILLGSYLYILRMI
jgi:hypothetical protein